MYLTDLSGPELVALASALAVSLSNGHTAIEITTLGDFFSALGANLNTIADTLD